MVPTIVPIEIKLIANLFKKFKIWIILVKPSLVACFL